MITYIEGPEDVIACSVSGGFTSSEMSALVSKVEQALKTNAKTHMFVEIDGIADVDWQVIAELFPRSLAILGQLDRFGRIAVVSNDKWIRLWTRAESALLPNISYELFRARERERALDWVQGRADLPHAPALTILQTDSPSVIAFEFDGSVTAADMDQAVAELGPRLESGSGPLRVLASVGEFDFPIFSALFKQRYFHLKMETLKRLERYAVVGGPDWLRRAVKSLAPLLAFEMRYFERGDEAAAWQWIGASPATSRATASAAPAVEVA